MAKARARGILWPRLGVAKASFMARARTILWPGLGVFYGLG